MKSFVKLQQYKKCIVLFASGVVCSIFAFLIYILDPVKMVIEYQTKMKPDSMIFSLWKKPPIDVYIYVYVFNITNAEAFLKGGEKLKVEEIGPYVYQEMLENQNITWNDNGTVSYIPKRTVLFRPDMSVGLPEETYVTVPNIPMLGISSALHKAGFFVNYPFVQLANFLDSQPILHITLNDYLWGYDDSLVSLASTVVPSYINFDKFGLLDRMYDEGVNLFNMNIRGNENMTVERGRYLSLESLNGSPGLSNWGYVQEEGNETRPENSRCNSLRGATEGTVFPPHMDKSVEFRVFRKAFCRPIPIVYKETTMREGVPAYDYTLPDNFADPPELNPDNGCFCQGGECLKRGLMDLTPCYYNIPAAASLPHFLGADPSLNHNIEGLNPDYEKHSTIIALQPTLGIPVYVHSRVQTNLIMKETQYNAKVAPFNNMMVPLFWTDLAILGLPDDLLFMVKLGVNIGPTIQNALMISIALVGATLMCWSLVRVVMIVQQEQLEAAAVSLERRDSADPRLPLGYGPYMTTTMSILPTIKKFASRNDLFA